ncbi:uncharacterized protein B0P05DRAFT_527318 [Gilbertella persicaria]|uniref:Late embryogenesis abundant protein LEA-2 subgroup domain-containing protein n=1 Tax=Rhizopus stolonifer TaxID=4846 RepID=A0A367J5S4_RHIST|nr:uncharacterized protein B0P05DRAFT_527318 [Gilbertella persicaria]KAI8091393.1 hypothetical protein B0P05DRAFT_527318 [Gilbertella persicaria]RCH85256.1 hypothetical protein CU098_006258 [Rhizopus stolonifer]
MPLFKIRTKSRVTSDFGFSQPTVVTPVQNAYNAYNRLQSPNPTFEEKDPELNYYSRGNMQRDRLLVPSKKPYGFKAQGIEKPSKILHLDQPYRKSSYNKYWCCCCFPCLPAWTRTICCFLFLVLCGVACLLTFFLLSFRTPQILFVGQDPNASLKDILDLQYSIFNSNFFEFNFDHVKTVAYYPTINRTTVGTGKLSNLHLAPQTVTNVTFPMRITSTKLNSNDTDINSDVIRELFSVSCQNEQEKKNIEIDFDLMATLNFRSSPLITFAFTGQKTTIPCDKLNSFINSSQ